MFAPHVRTAHAQSRALTRFVLDKREAASGETVTVTWASRVAVNTITLHAALDDGPLAPVQPEVLSSTINTARTAGTITFVIKTDRPISPLVIYPRVDDVVNFGARLRMPCAPPWFFEPRLARCPSVPTQTAPAMFQPFERGLAFRYRYGDKAIVDVLYRDGRWRRFDDTWTDGKTEDPATRLNAVPTGKFQPVGGIGQIWRVQPRMRFDLGWATAEARPYITCITSSWGGGRALKLYTLDPDNRLYELDLNPTPSTWRTIETIDGKPVKITLCR
jgi:hypothetical protein